MTKTERAKVKRVFETKYEYVVDCTCHIIKRIGYYGEYYVLEQYNGGWQTVTVEDCIDDILDLL